MDHSNTDVNRQPKERLGWLILFLRWFVGGIVGYISSLFLLIITETVYPPLLGPIIAGQQELFYEIFFYMSFDNFRSSDFIYQASVFVYSTLWGLIGALLASGRKKQKRFGMILLLLYVVAGGCFLMAWSVLSLAT